MMVFLLCLAAYLVPGLFYERRRFAMIQYDKSKQSRCAPACGSRDWALQEYRRQYCTCGYLKNSRAQAANFAWLLPLWLPHALAVELVSFLSTGTYEPKEVKAARKEREELERVQKSEERLRALERQAGIRAD